MEGSEIGGVVRLLRDETCHRWWRARFPGEPRFFGKSGGYPWIFISDSRRVQFDVQTVWPLLAGVIPNDPRVAPPFCRSQGIVRESSSRRGFRR